MKKTHSFLLVAALLLSVYVSCQSSVSRTESSLLWEISGNGLTNPSYLFGTEHGPQVFDVNKFFDRIPGFREAFYRVTQFAGEGGGKPSKEDLENFFGEYPMPDYVSYSEILSSKDQHFLDSITYRSFNKKADELKISPNYLMLLFFAQYEKEKMEKANLLEEEAVSIDHYLEEKAVQEGYKIISLDSPKINLKASSMLLWTKETPPQTLSEGAVYLIKRLNEWEREKLKVNNAYTDSLGMQVDEFIKKLRDAYYEDQDLQKVAEYKAELNKVLEKKLLLDSVNVSSLHLDVINSFLLDERNDIWMQQIPGLIKEQSTFIAVGALHLCGEKGLVSQLRDLGYTVQPTEDKK